MSVCAISVRIDLACMVPSMKRKRKKLVASLILTMNASTIRTMYVVPQGEGPGGLHCFETEVPP